MSKTYSLVLGLISLTTVVMAQSGLKPQGEQKLDLNVEAFEKQMNSKQNVSSRATQVCIDTNRWAWGRSISQGQATYYGAFLHADTNVPHSYGTFIEVPDGTTVTVDGFGFFGRSLRPDGNDVVVEAKIYAAGLDSLPTGNALASVSVSLDTLLTNNLSKWYRKAIFQTPITVNGSFVITIESSLIPGDSVQLVRGYTGSGTADGFPAVYRAIGLAGGDYFRVPGTSFGARLPHYYPFVSFSQTSSFSMSISQLSGPNQDIDFTYSAYSVLNHPTWSINGFMSMQLTYYSIDGGSSFSSASNGDTTITFTDETIDYNIVMNDTIIMWTNPNCVISEAQTLQKANPNSIDDVNKNEFQAFIANGQLNIINGEGEATLFDITGKIIRKFTVSTRLSAVNVSGIPEGVYILQVGDKVAKLRF